MATQTTDLKEFLQEIAEAIRVKRGHENLLSPQDFVNEIFEIENQEEPIIQTGTVCCLIYDYNYHDYVWYRPSGFATTYVNNKINYERIYSMAEGGTTDIYIEDLVVNSLLILFKPSSADIAITGQSSLIYQDEQFCILQVGVGISEITFGSALEE